MTSYSASYFVAVVLYSVGIMNTTNYTSQIIDLSFLTPNHEKSKADYLAELREQMLCNSRLRDKAGIENLVFGNGNPNADVFFVYDAPTADDERTRLAMSGQVGDLLFSLLNKIGLARKDVYVAPIMKYQVKTGATTRQATVDEIAECLPILKRQIEIVKPKIIVALGTTAFGGLFGEGNVGPIKNLRGKIFKFCDSNLIITYNASFLTHYADATIQQQFLNDITQAIAYTNLSPTQKVILKLKQKLLGVI